MDVQTYFPSEILKPFVKAFHVIQTEKEVRNSILPDTSLTIVFRFRGNVSHVANSGTNVLPKFAVSGLQKANRIIYYEDGSGNIIVRLKEGAGSMFFNESIHQTFGDSVNLDNFVGTHSLDALNESLQSALTNDERVKEIEQFLWSHLNPKKSDALVTAAIHTIRKSKGNIRIKSLADTLCISQDAFEKRFRRTVGATPKQFAYLVKMNALITGGQQSKSGAQLAIDAGFFDQSHFSHDFKIFTGQTPSDFFKNPPRKW